MIRKIGVFGGTFDPPHIGHQILASEARHQLGLDKVLWTLTPNPPHKQGRAISPSSQRLELVEAAIAGEPAFELSRVELDRPGPHYALDTVRILKLIVPGAALYYLVGGDSLADLPTWHQPLEFLAAIERLGVMHRPGDRIDLGALEASLSGITKKVAWIETPLLQISSTEIRGKIRAGEPYRYYLPENVWRIIQMKGYYRS